MFIFFMGSDPESSCSQYSCLRIYGFLSPDSSHTKPRLFTMFFYKFFRNVYYFFMGSDPTVVIVYTLFTELLSQLSSTWPQVFLSWRYVYHIGTWPHCGHPIVVKFPSSISPRTFAPVVRLIARLPLRGKFTADDCLRQVVALCVLAELEPLMLDDTSPRSLTISVVHCGITLKIGLIQQFRLKADRTILYRVWPQCFTQKAISVMKIYIPIWFY